MSIITALKILFTKNKDKSLTDIYNDEKQARKVWRSLSELEKTQVIKLVEANFPEDEQNEEILNQTIKLRKKQNPPV